MKRIKLFFQWLVMNWWPPFLQSEIRELNDRDAAIHMAKRFAAIAASDNPRFDTRRFLSACGIS